MHLSYKRLSDEESFEKFSQRTYLYLHVKDKDRSTTIIYFHCQHIQETVRPDLGFVLGSRYVLVTPQPLHHRAVDMHCEGAWEGSAGGAATGAGGGTVCSGVACCWRRLLPLASSARSHIRRRWRAGVRLELSVAATNNNKHGCASRRVGPGPGTPLVIHPTE